MRHAWLSGLIVMIGLTSQAAPPPATVAEVRQRLAEIDAQLAKLSSVESLLQVTRSIGDAQADIAALGPAGAQFDNELGARRFRLARRVPAVAEIGLLNLTMRTADVIGVLETAIPDPIDAVSARAEVQDAETRIATMRAVLSIAGSALARNHNDWPETIAGLDRRLAAARAKIEARIARRGKARGRGRH